MPESGASEWFSGTDKSPLPISLDPARRGQWEAELAKGPTKATTSAPAILPSNVDTPIKVTSRDPTPPSEVDTAAATASLVEPTRPKSPAVVEAPEMEARSPDTPPIKDGETYSSTEYKARIIAQHIKEQLEGHRRSGEKSPMFVGLQGPQGCGAYLLQYSKSQLTTRQNHSMRWFRSIPQ